MEFEKETWKEMFSMNVEDEVNTSLKSQKNNPPQKKQNKPPLQK